MDYFVRKYTAILNHHGQAAIKDQ